MQSQLLHCKSIHPQHKLLLNLNSVHCHQKSHRWVINALVLKNRKLICKCTYLEKTLLISLQTILWAIIPIMYILLPGCKAAKWEKVERGWILMRVYICKWTTYGSRDNLPFRSQAVNRTLVVPVLKILMRNTLVHLHKVLYPHQGGGGAYPGNAGAKQEYFLNGMPVHCKALCIHIYT